MKLGEFTLFLASSYLALDELPRIWQWLPCLASGLPLAWRTGNIYCISNWVTLHSPGLSIFGPALGNYLAFGEGPLAGLVGELQDEGGTLQSRPLFLTPGLNRWPAREESHQWQPSSATQDCKDGLRENRATSGNHPQQHRTEKMVC